MNIIKLPISEPVLLIKDFFNEEEKSNIVQELEFICKEHKLQTPDVTGSATNNNKILKNNVGLFLDNVYNERLVSNILTVTRKYFNAHTTTEVEKADPLFKYLARSDFDSTLVSYYENNDYYEAHEDEAILTIITYYWKEPKRFTGGSLTFTDHEYTVDVQPWDVVIFPSFVKHQVKSVNLLPEVEKNKLNGRVAISTFVYKRGDRR